jgi:hypothetical protein
VIRGKTIADLPPIDGGSTPAPEPEKRLVGASDRPTAALSQGAVASFNSTVLETAQPLIAFDQGFQSLNLFSCFHDHGSGRRPGQEETMAEMTYRRYGNRQSYA